MKEGARDDPASSMATYQIRVTLRNGGKLEAPSTEVIQRAVETAIGALVGRNVLVRAAVMRTDI